MKNEEKENMPMSILIVLAQCIAVAAFIGFMALFILTPPPSKSVVAINKPIVTDDVARFIVAPQVVPFRILQKNNQIYATGFYLNYLGKSYIMTNKHVCDASEKLDMGKNIIFGNVVETIIAIDDVHDLCLVTSSYHKGGLLLAANDLSPLDKMILVGHPRGLELTIREGRLISTSEGVVPWITNKEPVAVHQISATAYGGNSGSPVTNSNGEVVGVLFAGIDEYPHEPFVVPHKYLVRFLNKVILGL